MKSIALTQFDELVYDFNVKSLITLKDHLGALEICNIVFVCIECG